MKQHIQYVHSENKKFRNSITLNQLRTDTLYISPSPWTALYVPPDQLTSTLRSHSTQFQLTIKIFSSRNKFIKKFFTKVLTCPYKATFTRVKISTNRTCCLSSSIIKVLEMTVLLSWISLNCNKDSVEESLSMFFIHFLSHSLYCSPEQKIHNFVWQHVYTTDMNDAFLASRVESVG